MNNKKFRSLSLSLLSKPKGGAHWYNCSSIPLQRGSEALLSKGLDGLSDSEGVTL